MTWRNIAKFASVMAIVGCAALLFIAWTLGSKLTAPTPYAYDTPVGAEAVSLVASDGASIFGALWRPEEKPKATLLLLHGNGADTRYLASNAKWFQSQGYAVFAIDFRGHGRSQKESKSFGLFESQDAQAASDWLKQEYREPPHAIIGISLGGAAALLAEAGPIKADVYIFQAVFNDIQSAIGNRISCRLGRVASWFIEPLLSYQSHLRYGVGPKDISPITRVSALSKPALFIAGGADCYAKPGEIEQMSKLAGTDAQFWTVAELGHAQVSSLQSIQYREKVVRFIESQKAKPDK